MIKFSPYENVFSIHLRKKYPLQICDGGVQRFLVWIILRLWEFPLDKQTISF